jgi:hypothetical protein
MAAHPQTIGIQMRYDSIYPHYTADVVIAMVPSKSNNSRLWRKEIGMLFHDDYGRLAIKYCIRSHPNRRHFMIAEDTK